MLSDTIPYSKLEPLLLQWRFFLLASCFLIVFSSLSNFLLKCMIECFMGLVFFLPFLAAWKSDCSIPSFSYLWQSLASCVVHAPQCFLQRLQCFSVPAFLETLPVYLVPGVLFPFLPLWEPFSMDCAFDLSLVHTRSMEHVHGGLFSLGLSLVYGFLGLFDFRHEFSLQGRESCLWRTKFWSGKIYCIKY